MSGEVIRNIEPFFTWQKPREITRFSGGTARCDVAIIGAGLAGISTAYHLLCRKPGMRVVVVEANQIGAGASGRTTGMLSPGVGQSLFSLVKRLGPERAKRLYAETLRAVSSVAALISREAIDCDLEMTGQLVVARSAKGQRRLQLQAQLMQRLELPHIENEETLHLLPLGRNTGEPPDRGAFALRIPDAGILHPMKLLLGLHARILARGGTVYEDTRVLEIIKPSAQKPTATLRLSDGELQAENVVVATAGYTPKLGLFRGCVMPVHLQALVTEPLDAQATFALGWTGREGALDARRLFSYFRLTRDNRILFGGGAPRYGWGGKIESAADAEHALFALAAEYRRTFPDGLRPPIVGGWTGVIGYVLDALPAIARMPSCPQVVHAVGWCGHGVALATASGEWVTRILCEGAVSDDLPWFRATIPKVPTELARFIGFRASVGAMSLMDAIH